MPTTMALLLPLLLFDSLFMMTAAQEEEEEICGELEVHKQQWIGGNGSGIQLLARTQPSSDLRECLQRCCAIPDCSAVTFSGFLGPSKPGSANCSLFECAKGGVECQFVDAPEAAEFGVLSVKLLRRQTDVQSPQGTLPNATEASGDEKREKEGQPNRTWPLDERNGARGEEEGGGDGQILPRAKEKDLSAEELANMRRNATIESRHSLLDLGSWDERFPLNAEFTPVWAIGLAIVVTVVSLGLLMALLGSFLCYRRYRSRMRSTDINGPKKMPTLHAFNPSS